MTPDDILKQPSRFAMAKALPSRRLRRDPVDAVSDAAVLLSALRHRLRDQLGQPHPEESEPRIGPYRSSKPDTEVIATSPMFVIFSAADR